MKSYDNNTGNDVVATKIQHLGEETAELQYNKRDPLDPEFTESNKKKENDLPPVPFFKLFRHSTAMEKFILFIATLSAVGTGLCQPANVFLFGELTDSLISFGQNRSTSNFSVPSFGTSTHIFREVPPDISQVFLDAVTRFAVGNTVLGAIMLIFSYISIMAFNYVAQKQIFRIRDLYLKSALQQNIGWYDLNQSGDFASRMSEDLLKLEEGLGEKVVMFAHFQVAFLSSLILAFIKGWELALICLTSFPVTMIAMGLVGVVSSRLSKQELEAYGKAGAIAEEVLSSVRTVMAFGGQKKEVERYKSNLTTAKNLNIKRAFFNGLGFGLLWFFIYASYALAFWYGVSLVIRDKHVDPDKSIYDPGTMVTVFFSVMTGSMNFGMASPYIETFGIARGAGAKVFSVIDRKSPIDSMSDEGKKPDYVKGTITFEDVHFEYPSRLEVKILQGLNLQINQGETVALVGSSGCGKSTCIQLIQRFYDPLQGVVKLDGIDLKDLNVAWLRRNIGVVGQEPVLFQTTVLENIRYGKEDATIEEVEQAAKAANAHDFIMKLPQGYKTLVGERGAQISGGQKQRIAIARALVREPKILLLDEATSALDTSSEAKVQNALDKASKGRTTIIVAHRLSTIRNADKIVVISNGKAVEQGTYNELMNLKAHFHTLVNAQIYNINVEDQRNSIEGEGSHRKLSRLVSVRSDDSSSEDPSDNEPIPVIDITEEENYQPVSMQEILKMNKKEWPFIVTGTVSSVGMGCAMPLFAVLFGELMGILALPDDNEIRQQTDIYALYFVIAGVVSGFATFLQIYTYGIAGELLTMRLRALTFGAMLRQEVAWFDDKTNSTGALCARLSGDAANVQGATGQRIGTIVQSLATLFLSVGLSMYYDWKLGLVALSFTPVILITNYFFRSIISGETLGTQKAMEKSTKFAVEAVSNIRTVVGLGRESTFHQKYMAELHPAHVIALRNTHFRGIVFGLARSIMFFAYSTCMYYGGKLIEEEDQTIQNVFKVSQALIMGTVSIANAIAFAPNFQKGMTAASKIFYLLKRKPLIEDKQTYPDDKWIADGNVQLKEIEFCYPTRPGTKVLKKLNLTVQKGQTVALVGQSGCGKSTCIQLLERYYDPDTGVVSLDDRNIADMSLSSLRSQLGLVQQEPILFDRTIAENIAYGENSRDVTIQEIIDVSKKANIHRFITGLPLGYETRMGEKGTQLSGGQKQRVAIARALLRNPRVLLLDEATSALDTESEKIVQEALDAAKKGRTCITIAHRLSTIQDADVICVINQGQVVEQGTHNQLISRHGMYYKLCTLQNGKH